MANFKVGDKVRAGFSVRGTIQRIYRKRGMEFAAINTGEPMTREVPTSNLTHDA
jgi:hypothetical protein